MLSNVIMNVGNLKLLGIMASSLWLAIVQLGQRYAKKTKEKMRKKAKKKSRK